MSDLVDLIFTEEELERDMEYMNLAFEKPVLRVEDLSLIHI